MQRGSKLSPALFIRRLLLRPLGALEDRKYVDVFCPWTKATRRRSVITNTATEDRRFELPLQIKIGQLVSNVWHAVMDMGSIGDPALNWFFRCAGGYGTQSWDRLHRVVNDWLEGVSEAGLAMTRYEWMAFISLWMFIDLKLRGVVL